jgi:putative protein kinase ArgK-like GTPase of G3E family
MGQRVPVLVTSAEAGEGIVELCKTILAHKADLKISGKLTICQHNIDEMRISKIAQDLVREAVEGEGQEKMEALLSQTLSRKSTQHRSPKSLFRGCLKYLINIRCDDYFMLC